MIGKELDTYIQNKVKEVLDKGLFPEYDDIHSDSFSELIDKLDAMSIENDPEKMVTLKRKADVTFKQKRPMLVKSIDKIISNMCVGKFEPITESPKLYNGFDDDDEKRNK
jgi:hypothetical protein